jgi:hypothetical protein
MRACGCSKRALKYLVIADEWRGSREKKRQNEKREKKKEKCNVVTYRWPRSSPALKMHMVRK